MQFEFKGLQPEELRKLLYDVCENENLEQDQVTIENIIQESKGMPRNALWLLQRAVSAENWSQELSPCMRHLDIRSE